MITHTTSGSIVLTGAAIEFYRIASMKAAVGLELKGIRVRRGPMVWTQVKREFGLRGNKQKVYDWLCARVEEMAAQQEHTVETRTET